MIWTLGSKKMLIGLDIGTSQIKAAQFARNGGEWQICASCVIPRNDGEGPLTADQVARVRYVLQRQGFRGNQVVVAVADRRLLTGIIDLPAKSSATPIAKIARMELARVHKTSPGSFEMSCWEVPSPEPEGPTQAIAVALRHDLANELLDALEDGGLNVKALEPSTCALARACGHMLDFDPSATAALEIGWRSVTLEILHHNAIAYQRSLTDLGMETLFSELRQAFQLTDEAIQHLLATVGLDSIDQVAEGEGQSLKELAKVASKHFDMMIQELLRSVSYFVERESLTEMPQLLLAGGGARVRGLAEYFSCHAKLQAQVFALRQKSLCEAQNPSEAFDPSLAVAAGLAMFGQER